MTSEERYQGHSIFVWTEGAPPYCWRYTIDSFLYAECKDDGFSCENDALLAGMNAARLAIAHLKTRPIGQQRPDVPRSSPSTGRG
jgi:hypothetical protein